MCKLADLVSLYKQRLEQFEIGSSESDPYPTRLKEKLLAEISELETHKSGRDILLALLYHKHPTILKPSYLAKQLRYCEGICLIMTSNLMAGFMRAVSKMQPTITIEFVCMIEHGVVIKSQLRFGASKTDSAMAQLL